MGMIKWSPKSRPKKIPRASSKTPKNSLYQNLTPKKSHALLNNSKVRLFLLYLQNYSARALLILVDNPQKSLLKSSTQNKYTPNFRAQKNSGIENFKPKKILQSPPSLEIPSSPPPSLGFGFGFGLSTV